MQRFLVMLLFVIAALPVANAQYMHSDEGIAVPLPEERYVLTQNELQASMSLSKAHNAFQQFVYKNTSWNFRYDALRNTPHRAWGSGIQIDGFRNINLLNAPQAGKAFIEAHAAMLNVRPSELRMLYSEIVSGKAYQKYVQVYNGIDVLHSYVDLRISPEGRVFMFGSDFNPSIDVDTNPTVSLAAAREFAKVGLPYSASNDNIEGGTLYVLPVRYANYIKYRLVYNFQVQNGPEERWDMYVDAHDGSIAWRYDMITHLHGGEGPNASANVVNGRVLAKVYNLSYTEEAQTLPLANAYVWVAGTMYTTDDQGRFTADLGSNTTGQLIARLSGPHVLVHRDDTTRGGGAPANAYISETVAAGQNLDIVFDDENSIASERNTFYHMNLVRDWSRALDSSPNNSKLDDQIPGLVEIDNTCNAFFDGTGVNFFQSSLQCGNTGQIASVIHHEMGHGIHIWLTAKLTGRAPSNGALKEAIADMTSNFLADDPRIGVGFMKGGANGGIIRNSDNTLRYPDDVVNEIHDDGMILTGAVWDVREAIGLQRATRLYHDAMYGAPDANSLGVALADYFVEFLAADDDDGDLSNGTPNSEAIIEAFAAHGIPGSAITIVHAGMEDQHTTSGTYQITGVARVGSEINPDLMHIERVDIVYSTDNWQNNARFTCNYDPGSETFTGEFPAQKAGTIVRYYVEAFDNFGSSLHEPMKAPESSYLFLVGFERKYFNDAESADGWSVLSDATTGEWINADPVGTWNTQLGNEGDVPYVQPDEDHTPGAGMDKCWVTGNASKGSGLGTNDVDDGETYLTTRSYDVTNMVHPVLRYYRWYSNDAGATPGTDYWSVQISSDGGRNYEYLERTLESDASWKAKVFELEDMVDLTDKIVVKFTAADNEPGSLVEAAVDDFEILDINAALDVDDALAPVSLALGQNYPNPFNPTTSITYTLPTTGEMTLTVYNALGDVVRVLESGVQSAGTHTVAFDAGKLSSGLYMYELRSGGSRLTRKMMLLE
ncbi:T9SS type A sorting domain-containing protein [bacterium]|nr:T9SS type A sorting domain-containing protein [bacterium]